MVERLIWDQEAAGSSPVSPTIQTHTANLKIQSLCYWFKSNYVAFRILINGQIERMIYVSSLQPCRVMVTRRTLTPSLLVRPQPGLPLNQQYKLCRLNYTLLISVRQERKEMIKRPNLVLIEIFKIPLSYNSSITGSEPVGRGAEPCEGAIEYLEWKPKVNL